MDHLVHGNPVMWGPIYIGLVLLVSMAGLLYCLAHQHRIFPRVNDPEELRLRLAGEWHASSDEDYSVGDLGALAELSGDEAEVASAAAAARGARVRRRAAPAAAPAPEAEGGAPAGGAGGASGSGAAPSPEARRKWR
jgi:hypothetical protein